MQDLITQLQDLFFKPSLWDRYGEKIVYEGLVMRTIEKRKQE